MGLLDILRGVADQADFIPSFDPVKDKQGLLSQLLSGRERYGQTPPIVQPGTVQPANAVQKNPAMMAAPGGANPYAEFAKPRGILKRMITPNSLDRQYDAKHMAFLEHRDMAAKAKQVAEAAKKEHERNFERLYNQAAQMNLSPEQTTAYIQAGLTNSEKLGENLAQQFKPRSIGEGVTERIAGQSDFYQPKTATPLDPQDFALRQQNANAATLQAQAAMHRAQNPSAGVSITNNLPSNKGESAFQTERGKSASSKMDAINSAGDAAASAIADADMMNSLIDQIDYTGMGSETLMNIQKAGRMLGLDIGDDVPAKEAAVRLTAKLGLALKSDLPGPMSDGDRQFLLSIPPNIGTTRAGNKALVFMMKKKAQFQQDMQASLNRANPQTMEEFYAWEQEFRASYPPLFDEASKRDLMAAIGAGQ